MNFYTNWKTGFIDGLLTRIAYTDYAIAKKEEDPKWNTIPYELELYSKALKTKVKRLNLVQKEVAVGGPTTERSRSFGSKLMPIDTYLKTFMMKKNMIPSMGNIEHSKEYNSPFENSINRMLLVYKWILGIQAITKDTVVISKEELVKLGMDHKSVMDIKKAFDKLFYNNIVTSYYEDHKWFIKLTGGSFGMAEGPGYINISIPIPGLVKKIKEHHKELQQN